MCFSFIRRLESGILCALHCLIGCPKQCEMLERDLLTVCVCVIDQRMCTKIFVTNSALIGLSPAGLPSAHLITNETVTELFNCVLSVNQSIRVLSHDFHM